MSSVVLIQKANNNVLQKHNFSEHLLMQIYELIFSVFKTYLKFTNFQNRGTTFYNLKPVLIIFESLLCKVNWKRAHVSKRYSAVLHLMLVWGFELTLNHPDPLCLLHYNIYHLGFGCNFWCELLHIVQTAALFIDHSRNVLLSGNLQ